jgi:hypothetical protein
MTKFEKDVCKEYREKNKTVKLRNILEKMMRAELEIK